MPIYQKVAILWSVHLLLEILALGLSGILIVDLCVKVHYDKVVVVRRCAACVDTDIYMSMLHQYSVCELLLVCVCHEMIT